MDQPGTDKASLIREVQLGTDAACVSLAKLWITDIYEQLAVCDEGLLEAYLSENRISDWDIRRAVRERKVFLRFGSASTSRVVFPTRNCTVPHCRFPRNLGRRSSDLRDEQGRLTHLKITGWQPESTGCAY